MCGSNAQQYKRTDQTYITKVADFGLAAIKPKAKKTIRADPRGTPLTRAPEVSPRRPRAAAHATRHTTTHVTPDV